MAAKQKPLKPLKVPVMQVEIFDGDAVTRVNSYRQWLAKHHEAIQKKDIVIVSRLYAAHEMIVEYSDASYHGPPPPTPTQLPA